MQKNLNWKYMGSHFFYFSLFASMFAFVSVFLLDKGFDNATIGTVLSIIGLLAIGIQTLLANFMDQYKEFRLQDLLTIVLALIIFASALLYFVTADLLILLLVVITFSLTQMAMTFVNSLGFIYNDFGIRINYGLARGMGSLSYALVTVVVGNFVEAISPAIIPIFYMLFAFLLLLAVRSYVLPEEDKKILQNVQPVEDQTVENTVVEAIVEEEAAQKSMLSFILKYKRLVLLMVGVVFLFFTHTLINNFFIQVITPIGGDSRLMGIAIFIGTIVEMPAMMNFNWLAKRISVSRLLKISAIFFIAKHGLTYLAPNMYWLYFAQFLQIGAFSVLYPALVEYINLLVSTEDLIKGQSLVTSAMALSSVFASFLGGVFLDSIGVSTTLFLGVVTTFIGLGIVFLTVEKTA